MPLNKETKPNQTNQVLKSFLERRWFSAGKFDGNNKNDNNNKRLKKPNPNPVEQEGDCATSCNRCTWSGL